MLLTSRFVRKINPGTSRLARLAFFALALVNAPIGSSVVSAQTLRRIEADSPSALPFDGWGTSLCWFGNAVGRWPEAPREAIADLLFKTDGLGFTVVRYNIGGGEQPGHAHMPPFRQMEGFESLTGTWNWQADPGQRWMLAAAIKRGATQLEAFSNSPPYWMTVSGCASGDVDPSKDNLKIEEQGAFVDYLVEVVRHFREDEKIAFQTLDPFNESASDYWKARGKQEGCHFDAATQAVVLKQLRRRLDARGLSSVKLSASDETNFSTAIRTFDAFDEETKALVDPLNSHAYATDRREELAQLAARYKKTLVMSEVDGAGGKVHDHEAMEPALELADRIVGDFKGLHPIRWVFWQAVEDEKAQASGNKNWGLIHADLGGDTHAYTLTKKYYAMAQFSRFIRPGAHFLAVDEPNTVAAWQPDAKTLIVVVRNPTADAFSSSYDLSEFPKLGGKAELYRTSTTENIAPLPPLEVAGKRLTLDAPAQSITTVIVSSVQ